MGVHQPFLLSYNHDCDERVEDRIMQFLLKRTSNVSALCVLNLMTKFEKVCSFYLITMIGAQTRMGWFLTSGCILYLVNGYR